MILERMKNSITDALKEEAVNRTCYWGSVECFDSYEDLTEDLYRWFKSEGLTIDYVKPVKEYNRVEFKVNWKVEYSEEETLRYELVSVSKDNLVYTFKKIRKDLKSWLSTAKSRRIKTDSISFSTEDIKDDALLESKIRNYMEHLSYTDFDIKVYYKSLVLTVRFR